MMHFRNILLLLACLSTSSYAQKTWVQIHPGTVSWYQAVSENAIYVLSDDNLERSLDGGDTWKVLSKWPKTEVLSQDQFHRSTVSTSPIHFGSVTHGLRTRITSTETKPSNTFFLSTVDEVTTDGGVTWTPTLSRESSNLPSGAAFFEPSTWMVFRKYNYDPQIPTLIPSFAVSTDAGMTWKETKEGFPFHNQFIAPRPEVVFLGSLQSSLVSHDSGATWQEIPYGIDMALTPNTLYHKQTDTSYFSTDDGKTWTFTVDSFRVRWTNGKGLVYASVGENQPRFYRSLDTGRSYEKLFGFQYRDGITLFDTNLVYALQDGTLLKSLSGGQIVADVKRAYNDPSLLELTINGDVVHVSEAVEWFDLLGRPWHIESTEDVNGWVTYNVHRLPKGMYFIKSATASRQVLLH